MRTSLINLALVGLAGIVSPILSAQRATSINVTTTVSDDNGSTPLLMRSDDYNGTMSAVYANAKKGPSDVSTYIDASGNWALYVANSRTLYLTPNVPVGSQPLPVVPLPTPGYYGATQEVQVHALCPAQFPSLGMGISCTCQVGVEFHYSGLVYKLAMGPALPWGGPQTGVASVVCNQVSSNQCVSWTIASDATSTNPNVANLYYYNTGTGTWVFIGQYYNTFLIKATNP